MLRYNIPKHRVTRRNNVIAFLSSKAVDRSQRNAHIGVVHRLEKRQMTTAIVLFGLAGVALIIGLCVAEMRASAKHQRWTEENNKRRHGIK